jgi:hypothetical protein
LDEKQCFAWKAAVYAALAFSLREVGHRPAAVLGQGCCEADRGGAWEMTAHAERLKIPPPTESLFRSEVDVPEPYDRTTTVPN